MAYKVVSLFSGCGGLDIGFKEIGFNLQYACDIDPFAVECYRRNVDKNAFVRDVRDELFHNDIQMIGNTDIVLGGFPCQGFSKAGPKKPDDKRNTLYKEMKNTIQVLNPTIFIAENVDGLEQNFGGKIFNQIFDDFSEIGYFVQYRIIDAVSFGVAQHRRRILFVGIKDDIDTDFKWPIPTHSERLRNGDKKYENTIHKSIDKDNTLQKCRSISDVIGDLLSLSQPVFDHEVTNNWPSKYNYIFKRIKQGQKLCNVRHSKTSVYTWEIPEAFGKVTKREVDILNTIAKNRRLKKYGNKPNGNPLSISEIERLSGLSMITIEIMNLLSKGYLKEIDNKYDLKGAMFCSGLFKRPNWSEPSPTVLTNFHNPRYFLHPLMDRPFSARECARLQGFPDSFRFSWDDFFIPLEKRYKLIGNAVAAPVSRAMANAVKYFLRKLEIDNNETNDTSNDFIRMAIGI